MSSLTTYIQREFQRNCPDGWICSVEQLLFSHEWAQLLGYAPRVDVLMARNDGKQRLWIEFEISRADPVANHAKFATAHLFQPQPETDAFVSMVSAHVTRGRQNLAANAIHLMRAVGMRAFQMPLFPMLPGRRIHELNHADSTQIDDARLDILTELQRALAVVEPVFATLDYDIHYVSNISDVMLNLFRWNQDIDTPGGRDTWGRRTVTYFVCDPKRGQFAPSKFCAYLPLPNSPSSVSPIGMNIPFYAAIDGSHPKFDGGLAWNYLVNHLVMNLAAPDGRPKLMRHFTAWAEKHKDSINVHPSGPRFLLPPSWY